jgi:hypothetical protein
MTKGVIWLIAGYAGDLSIMTFGLPDFVIQPTECNIDSNDSHHADRYFGKKTGSSQTTDSGTAPDSRGGRQTLNINPLMQDHTGSEKSDAGNYLANDPGWVATLVLGYLQREQNKYGGSHGNQPIGTNPRTFMVELPLQPDQ